MTGHDNDESANHTNSRRNFLRTVATGAAATSFAGVASANPGKGNGHGRTNHDGSGTVTFLHDTHVHGHYGDVDATVNVENYFGLMDELKSENPKLLRVGNGDDLASSVLSAVFQGKHIVDAFDAGGLDYDTFGIDLLPRLKTRESHHGISGRAWPYGFKTHTFQTSLAW